MKKWIINNNVFDSAEQNNNVSIVLQDIVDEFDRLIPAGPSLGFKPINLVNDIISGPTFYWPMDTEFYKIGLNVADVNYNQIAFQFSQELCRIYCDPRLSNWFIDLFCHIAALYSLDFLGQKWEDSPPNDELKDYWYNFDSYKSNLLSAAFSKVDMVKYQVANEWVQYQVSKLKKNNRINRGKLMLIAYELLPMFKDHPESWQILPFIGKCSEPEPPEDLVNTVFERRTEPNFEKLARCLPSNLETFITKFYEKIGAKEYI